MNVFIRYDHGVFGEYFFLTSICVNNQNIDFYSVKIQDLCILGYYNFPEKHRRRAHRKGGAAFKISLAQDQPSKFKI